METTVLTKYDQLIHVHNERKDLTEDEVFSKAQILFPDLSKEPSDHYYDQYFPSSKIEMYAYYRSVGNPPKTCAHCLELSEILINEALVGKGLSFETFFSLVSAEVFCRAELKAKHLKNLELSSKDLLFLQTVFPEEFQKDSLNLKPFMIEPEYVDAEGKKYKLVEVVKE